MKIFQLAVFLLMWSGLAPAGEIVVDMLLYQKGELGIDPYPSRILMNEDFMRMDEGGNSGNFLLFDRGKQHIYSVTHDDKTVFEIPMREVKLQSPEKLHKKTEKKASEDMPTVAGMQPQHYQLSVNGIECYNVIAIGELLPVAQQALREFRRVLAGEHARVLPQIPADMRNSCEMALHTFYPEWQLEFGLPIHEWDTEGSNQSLINYKSGISVNAELFELPKGYQYYSTDNVPTR